MITVAVVVVIAAIISLANQGADNSQPGKLDGFAQCLKDKGALFYGAFWCPHCKNQKALFGGSQKLLHYVECSTPDGTAQLPVCTAQNVHGYPTWIFKDGSRLSGEVSLATLAEKTGCTLPTGQ